MPRAYMNRTLMDVSSSTWRITSAVGTGGAVLTIGAGDDEGAGVLGVLGVEEAKGELEKFKAPDKVAGVLDIS